MTGIMGGAAGSAGITYIIEAIDKYSKEFKKVDKGIKQQQTSFQKLGNTLHEHKILAIAAAGAITAFGIESVKSALKSEVAFQQFNLALGDSAEIMLKDMKDASHGMISDFNLVTGANKALALGISKTDIPKLLEAATARAKVFGRTTTEAFEDLTIGIGRQSRMILDNLGIILDLKKVYAEYAVTLGKTADELTNFEQKAAITNAIIEDSEGLIQAQAFLMDTHAEKIAKLVTGWDNLKDAVGIALLAMLDYADGTYANEQAIRDNIDVLVGVPGTYDEVSEAILASFNAQKKLTEEYKASTAEVDRLIDSLLNLKDITFVGERQKKLDIAQQKETIRVLELRKKTEEALIPSKKEFISLMDTETDLQKEMVNKQRTIDDLTLKYLAAEEDERGKINDEISKERDLMSIMRIQRKREKEDIEKLDKERKDQFKHNEEMSNKTLDNTKDELKAEKDKLSTLRLEQDKYANDRAIKAAENELELEKRSESEQGLEQFRAISHGDFLTDNSETLTALDNELTKQNDIKIKNDEIKESHDLMMEAFGKNQLSKEEALQKELDITDDVIAKIDKLIARYDTAIERRRELGTAIPEELTKEEQEKIEAKRMLTYPLAMFSPSKLQSIFKREDPSKIFTGKLPQSRKVFDAIITKKGEVIETDPEDTIIATKTPGSLGGKGGVTININNLNGFNARDIANKLQK